MKTNKLRKFFNSYIRKTAYKATVLDYKKFICFIDEKRCISVYITTRALKHLYDKKPAEEFDFIIDNTYLIIKYTEKIYKNKSGKHGDICLIKTIGNSDYLCSLEKISLFEFQIVTVFRIRDADYLKNYILLWNRGSDKPHRHATDFFKNL